jgi:hypothetical protein
VSCSSVIFLFIIPHLPMPRNTALDAFVPYWFSGRESKLGPRLNVQLFLLRLLFHGHLSTKLSTHIYFILFIIVYTSYYTDKYFFQEDTSSHCLRTTTQLVWEIQFGYSTSCQITNIFEFTFFQATSISTHILQNGESRDT